MSAFTFSSVSALAAAVFCLSFALVSCDRSTPSPSPVSSHATAEEKAPLRASDSGHVHDSSHPLDITVTSEGFVPARAKVKVGQPVTLVVTRKVERTCATEIVIKDYGINQALPHGQPVKVTFTPTKAGPIRYACAMDMVAGELVAE